jgi:hypothetical protein
VAGTGRHVAVDAGSGRSRHPPNPSWHSGGGQNRAELRLGTLGKSPVLAGSIPSRWPLRSARLTPANVEARTIGAPGTYLPQGSARHGAPQAPPIPAPYPELRRRTWHGTAPPVAAPPDPAASAHAFTRVGKRWPAAPYSRSIAQPGGCHCRGRNAEETQASCRSDTCGFGAVMATIYGRLAGRVAERGTVRPSSTPARRPVAGRTCAGCFGSSPAVSCDHCNSWRRAGDPGLGASRCGPAVMPGLRRPNRRQ